MRIIQWKQKVLVATLGASLLGLPQMATAYDNCGRNDRYDGAYPNAYYPDYGRGYGYGPARSGDWNSGYYSDSYRDGYVGQRYRDDTYYGRDAYHYSRRSPGKSAAIVGGSAAAGAIVGALAGGGKGAAIGAAVGGVGGLIFDRATKNRGRR